MLCDSAVLARGRAWQVRLSSVGGRQGGVRVCVDGVQQAPVDEGVVHKGLQHGHDAVLVHAQHPHHILAGRPAKEKKLLQGLSVDK